MFGLHICTEPHISHSLRMNRSYSNMSLSVGPTYSSTGRLMVSINLLLLRQQGYYSFRPILIVRLFVTIAPFESLTLLYSIMICYYEYVHFITIIISPKWHIHRYRESHNTVNIPSSVIFHICQCKFHSDWMYATCPKSRLSYYNSIVTIFYSGRVLYTRLEYEYIGIPDYIL